MTATAPTTPATGDRRLRGLLVGMLHMHLAHQPPGRDKRAERWLADRLILGTAPVDGTATDGDVALVRRAAATCRTVAPHAAQQWDRAAADFAGGPPLATRRVLITGSRNWANAAAVRDALIAAASQLDADPASITVVHGDARGADRIAAGLAARLGMQVEAHPADWAAHGRAAGAIRNAEMVRAGADLCLAFPLAGSAGTRDCMRRAAAAGIRVIDHSTAPATRENR